MNPLEPLQLIGIAWQLVNREPWVEQALCAQCDPEKWFPVAGISAREARAICRGCPVQRECLNYALTHDERYGVWGGFSERERRALMRGGRQPTFKPQCGSEAGLSGHYRRGEHPCGACRAYAAHRTRLRRRTELR